MICFEIFIPLISTKSYGIFAGTPIPVFIYEKVYAQMILKEESLIVDDGRGTIFAMSESFLDSCVRIDLFFLCKNLPSSVEGECLKQTYVEAEETDCNYELQEIKKEYWKKTYSLNAWIFVADNSTSGVLKCGNGNNETIALNANIGRVTLRENCKFKTSSVELFTGNHKVRHSEIDIKKISKRQVQQMKEKLIRERFNFTYPKQEENDAMFLSTICIVFLIIFLLSLIFIEVLNTIKQRRLNSTLKTMRQTFLLKNLASTSNTTKDLNPIMRDLKRSKSFNSTLLRQSILSNITFPTLMEEDPIYDNVKGCRPVFTNEIK